MSAPALAPHPAWLVVAALVLAWFGASGPHPFDAGELVQASFLLGGSHPPGQPLHAIVAHATTLVPLGPVPWRMAWVSAAFAAIAAFLAGRIAGLVLEETTTERTLATRIAPDAVALATLLSPPVLRQATRVEIYGIALAVTLLGALAVVRWGAVAHGAGRWLRVAALCAGLAAALHPPHGLAVLTTAILVALASRREVFRRPRAIAWAALTCAAAMAGTIAYLPIRGAAGAPSWGSPTTVDGLWDYLTARAYRQNLGAGDAGVLDHLLSGTSYVALASGLVPLIGLALFVRPASSFLAGRAALLAIVGTLPSALVIAIDPDIADAAAYAGPPAAVLIAIGAAGFARVLAGRRGPMAVLSIAALGLLALNVPWITHASRWIAQDAPVLETYGGALADVPPPRALVVVEGDFEAATWMLAQAVDGARPDVAAFFPGLATSSWHWRSLAHHPLYDGDPIRGEGPTNPARYLDGAVRNALRRVPVAFGPRIKHGSGAIDGPYRVISAGGEMSVDTSLGERLAAVVAEGASESPEGDFGTVGGIVRHMQVARAERLAARGRTDDALRELAWAMAALPPDEREMVETQGAPAITSLPPIVDAPGSFSISSDDALRTAAAILWAAGERDRARSLLVAQLDRGDAAAALQLGWLSLDAGDREAAAQTAALVARDAPELAPWAERLAAAARGAAP